MAGLDYELISQADFVLSKCGGRVLPDGLVAVDFPGFLVYSALNSGTQITTGLRNNPEDTTFYVRAIQMQQAVADTKGRIQWPDGRYLSNQLCSLGGSAWFGPLKRVLTKPVPVKPGESITIETVPSTLVSPGTDTYVAIVFEGVFRYLLKGDRVLPILTAQDADRYARSPNGNILAPEMDLDTTFDEIPKGQERTQFILQSLSSSATTISSILGGTATIEVPVSQSFDFFARRFEFEYNFINDGFGTIYVKARDSSGYAFHSAYVPLNQAQDAPFGKHWCLKAGSSVFFDFELRNPSGFGTLNLVNVSIVGARQRGMA